MLRRRMTADLPSRRVSERVEDARGAHQLDPPAALAFPLAALAGEAFSAR